VARRQDNPEKNMSFLEHLEELRTCLIFSILFLVGGCVVGLFLARPVVRLLTRPFAAIELKRDEKVLRVRVGEDGALRVIGDADKDLFADVSPYRIHFYLPDSPEEETPDFVWGYDLQTPVFLSPLDPILLYFKASVIVGLIIALPFILHQVWLFVAPGLRKTERKMVLPILLLGSVLFPLGAAFAYMMLSWVLTFLLNFQILAMRPMLEISRFVNFELRLMMGFGVVFELPLVIMFLTGIGVIEPRQLRKYRPHAIVGIAVVSMVLTPPDGLTMLMMMFPLIILYEFSIWASAPLARRRREARMEDG